MTTGMDKNQHAHVQRLIDEKGLGGRVRMELRDYRDMPEDQPLFFGSASFS